MMLFIKKDLYFNKNISDYELLVYCYLQRLCSGNDIEIHFISIDALLNYIYGEIPSSKKIKENINNAIESLIDKEFITAEKLKNGLFQINRNSLYFDIKKERFTILSSEDLFKLTKINLKLMPKLLRYYLMLVGTFNSTLSVTYNNKAKKNIIGNFSLNALSTLTGLSVTTIEKYNDILIKNNMLYIEKAKNPFTVLKPNIYGRYEDKDFIHAYALEQKNYKPKTAADETKQSLAKKYYWLCSGKEYSATEIKEIYEYVIEHNDKMQELNDLYPCGEYLNRILPTSIFKKYDCLNEYLCSDEI